MVKKCKECQMHANLPHLAASSLTTIQAPMSFDIWEMHLLGPFPPASGQRRFLLVAVDYFKKWVEAAPLASITDKQVQQFIWQHLIMITRFGVPRVLISDNGRQFNSGPTRDYCSKFGIETRFSAVSRPQTNGQAEEANKVVLKGLKTMLEVSKGSWIDDLPGILQSTRITVRKATGHSPFNLVLGSEVVLPVELGIPSPGITFYDHDLYEEEKKINLDLLPETGGTTLLKAISCKLKLTRLFKRRVKHRPFQVNDWVLRKFEATGRQPKLGKLQPNWEGPY